jgi:PPOX class probable F420-dependent enzyme
MAEAVQPALDTLLRSTRLGALVALKRDGRPQLSNVGFSYDPDARLIRVSTADGRAKTINLHRDPRAGLYVTTPDFRAYAVVEGTAELTPVAADPHDAVVEELVDVYRRIAGDHPDWSEFRDAMVEERRLVVRLHIERVYGYAPPSD